jgi:hypothetical protein
MRKGEAILMFRRCISLIVIVGLFASQLAAVPHAHAGLSGQEQQEHDSTPHFHCSWRCHSQQGHKHSHGDHCHEQGGTEKPTKQPTEKPLPDSIADLGHDTNAVYAPALPLVVTAEKHHQPSTSTLILAANVAIQSVVPVTNTADGRRAYWHPPDAVVDGSGIYLALRNLRI